MMPLLPDPDETGIEHKLPENEAMVTGIKLRMPDNGLNLPGNELRMPHPGLRMPESELRLSHPGLRMPESELRLSHPGLTFPGKNFQIGYICAKTSLTKILIIRFSSMGDIVLTTPLLRCLKKQVPGVELHYLTKKQYRTILDENPYLDKIYTIEHGLREVMPGLREEHYDHLLDLHRNLRSTGVLLGLHRPFSRLHKLDVKKWLLVRFKINVLPKIHVVDRYLRVAKRFGLVNDGQGLDYFTRPEEISLPAAHRGGYVAFAIGGRHNTKMLPEEKIVEVCRLLGGAVILLGGPEDCEKGERITAACGEVVFNGCGRYSLNQSALLIRQAKLVITNDTGLMHIAAAFRKKIISTWGSTVTDFGMYPYLPETDREKSVMIEAKGLKCRPCSKLGFPECPKKHFDCMNKIEVTAMVQAARNLLASPA